MISDKIASKFKSLSLIKTMGLFASELSPRMHVKGRFQREHMRASPNIAPSASSVTPRHFGLLDYRAFIVEFLSNILLGDGFVSLMKLSMKRIISSHP